MTDKPVRPRKGAGWGTRAVRAGLDPAAQGAPLMAAAHAAGALLAVDTPSPRRSVSGRSTSGRTSAC